MKLFLFFFISRPKTYITIIENETFGMHVLFNKNTHLHTICTYILLQHVCAPMEIFTSRNYTICMKSILVHQHVYLLEFGININILIWALSLGPGIFDISKKVHAGVHVIYKTWKQHMEMNVAFLWSVF